jgi:hypothetical protein
MNALKSKTVLMGLAVALIPFLQALQALPLTTTQAQVISGILGVLVILNRIYAANPPINPVVEREG